MSTPSQPPANRRTESSGSCQTRGAGFVVSLFRRLKEVYFFGGLALVLVGAVIPTQTQHGTEGLGFAGLGLCIAGGSCFVAAAIIHSREHSR